MVKHGRCLVDALDLDFAAMAVKLRLEEGVTAVMQVEQAASLRDAREFNR